MTNPLARKLNKRFAQKQDEMRRLPGTLGDGFGNLSVPNAESFVYVLIGDKSLPVFNNRVTPQMGVKVWVGYAPEEPNLFQVLSTRSETPAGNVPGFTGYAPAKRYEWLATGGGQDPLHVHLRAISHLKIGMSTAGGLNVDLNRGYIHDGSAFLHIESQTLDLSADVPATTGKAQFDLITIDDTGTVIITAGSEVNVELLAVTDIPAVPVGTVWVCGAVRLYNGQTVIQEGRTNTDFVDLRFSGYGDGGGLTNPVDVLELNTSYAKTGSETAGSIYWNSDRETADLVTPNGAILQMGQELWFYVKNQTGSTISNGKVVMFDGALGASGIIKGKLAVADGTYPSYTIMGVATQDIANGDEGKVTFFGELRGIDTHLWAAGDKLYPDPTTPGNLTNVEPSAPNLRYPIATVLNSHAVNGVIFVRAIYTMGLHELDDVNTSASKTTPVDTDNLLLKDVADGVWKLLSWANLKAAITPGDIGADPAGSAATAETNSKAYADGLVVGLWDDRGSYDASGGAYPSTGGSGTAGAIKKGDVWTVSVAGTLPISQVVEVGDVVRALIDTPGNTQANWAITQNNIGYTAENSANKATTMSGNTTSNILYLTAKAVYDWATGLFQPLNSDLTVIAAITPSNDDIIQRKAGAWTNRTPTQFAADIKLVPPANLLTLVAASPYTLTVPASLTVAGRDVSNTFTRQQFVDGSADEIQLRVQANGTQTANLQTWENSSGTVLSGINSSGFMGIATAPSASAGLYVTPTLNTTDADKFSINANILYGDGTTGNMGNWVYGLRFNCQVQTTYTGNITGALSGMRGVINNYGSGNRSDVRGISTQVVNRETSTITSIKVLHADETLKLSTGAITTLYGLYIENQSVATNNYALYTNAGLVRFGDDVVMANAKNIQLQTTTGTKIGTATSQKLGFWNATPIVQPTTGVASATIVGGVGTTVKEDNTFDGYTLAQVVKALRNTGILA